MSIYDSNVLGNIKQARETFFKNLDPNVAKQLEAKDEQTSVFEEEEQSEETNKPNIEISDDFAKFLVEQIQKDKEEIENNPSIMGKHNYGGGSATDYDYDQDGKIDRTVVDYSNQFIEGGEDIIDYDDAGRESSIERYDGDGHKFAKTTYQYNDDGSYSQTESQFDSDGNLVKSETYNYDKDGNLIEE